MITENGIVPVKGGQYKPLSEQQIKELHKATMEVLTEVGIKIKHNEALDLMKGNGCDVDYDSQIVKIPEAVLMKYVKMAPSEFRMCEPTEEIGKRAIEILLEESGDPDRQIRRGRLKPELVVRQSA